MQYIVTKQIAVEADSPEDAAYKSKTEGQVMSLSVNIRPQSPMQPQIQVTSEALKKQQEAKK